MPHFQGIVTLKDDITPHLTLYYSEEEVKLVILGDDSVELTFLEATNMRNKLSAWINTVRKRQQREEKNETKP